ncbi:hypothetical protein D9756_011184 [Leucocoprinus leucothites]|uniref:SAC3/GANP/THP3 conserved domain-containing protein n=1 Tax=Leucocoprinus leucothites TaxID=201217 RepID=A0A8H5CPV5_9AGAR|nr:hypothetical protein D9756_011184 [Leucoagaricus leucothites]
MNSTYTHGPPRTTRGGGVGGGGGGRGHSRNRQWTANTGSSSTTGTGHGTEGERWERGGAPGRGSGRGRGGPRGRGAIPGRKFPNQTLRNNYSAKPTTTTTTVAANVNSHQDMKEEDMFDATHHDDEEEEGDDAEEFEFPEIQEPEFETQEEREKFYQELVKAREAERKRAIAEGKMDDPLVPKRLEDAITMVGTCMDMCPRFERYRRERENNLFEWETIPGTKRVDHKRAVKMYERAAGDKTLPSDLRPPKVLKASRTLDYLFHDLLPRGGFSQTYTFIRDRSRSVRNDFTMQHESGPIAIECHGRCARFHILALHFERDKPGFSVALEEQQLMNSMSNRYFMLIYILTLTPLPTALQSLKEFYDEQRSSYTSPNELEMRVYHRLIHIRDQRERHEELPPHITSDPVFKLTTFFRQRVQQNSAPITKTSTLLVDAEAMRLFGELAGVLGERGNTVMIYLVACLLERLFGKDTIEDIENIRGSLRIQDVIDGKVDGEGEIGERESGGGFVEEDGDMEMGEGEEEENFVEDDHAVYEEVHEPAPATGVFSAPTSFFAQQPVAATSAFANLASAGPTSVFGGRTFGATTTSTQPTSVFGIPPPQKVEEPKPLSQQQPLSIFGAASRKSLADAPPIDGGDTPGDIKNSGEISGLFSTSPQPPTGFGGAFSAVPSPFGTQAQAGTTATKAPTSFFGTPPTGSVKEEQGQEQGKGIPLFFGKQPALNPSAQAFVPLSGSIFGANTAGGSSGGAQMGGFGFGPTPSPAPVVQQPSTTPTPPAAPTSAPTVTTTPTAPPLTRPRKSITPPSLRIDTGSLSTSPTSTPVGKDGLPIIPMPIPPTPSSTATPSRPQQQGEEKPRGLRAEPTVVVVESPKVPPALGRRMPVSLPGTPGATDIAVPHPILGWVGANGESLSLPVTPTGSGSFNTGVSGGMLTPSGSGTLTPGGSVGSVLSPLDMPSFPSGSGLGSASSSPRKLGRGGIGGGGSQSLLTSTLLRRDKGKGKAVDGLVPFSIAIPPPPAPVPSSALVTTGKLAGDEEHVPSNTELKTLASTHYTHLLLSKIWAKWRNKYESAIKWAEAVQSSDAYRNRRAKLKMRRKRRMLEAAEGEEEGQTEEREGERAMVKADASPSSARKRQRKKRISDVFVEPRTDEEIARRFKENRVENQTLWAQGSYLSTIRTYIHSLTTTTTKALYHSYSDERKKQKPWNIWLSLNPESDSSAIWLERKFDVPKSGRWANENVFEIPIFETSTSEGMENGMAVITNGKNKSKGREEEAKYTGLIVFECTPTDWVKDDIEKKYCVLDDCSRLRDIMDLLSSKRHYVPSLLILRWGSGDQSKAVVEAEDEFVNMVKKYVDESVLAGYATLGITTTVNLDSVLGGVLRSVKLDVEGRLVRSMTLRGIFRTFEEEFSNFLIEWLDNCSANGAFDWTLYGHLVQATIGMLNKMGSLVSAMLSKQKRDLLPSFDVDAVNSSNTAYETAFTWLSRVNDQGDTEKIAVDLQSHINIGQVFPARTFIQHLLELTVLRTEKHTNVASSQARQDIPVVDLKAAEELFEAAIQPFQTQLNVALNMSVRRSPRRRSMSEETEGASPEAKRLKIAPSFASSVASALAATQQDVISPPATPYMNGKTHSPSPSIVSDASVALTESATSVSMSGSPPKQVTVAMLRALTKDMKRKYGSLSGSAASGKKAATAVSSPSTPLPYVGRR